MSQIILIIHVLAALSLIALVLLQHGKGADAGAAFGSGASNTMFGSVGTMPFLMKITVILATIFFATSISLSYLTSHEINSVNDLYKMPQPGAQPKSAPASSDELNAPPAIPSSKSSLNDKNMDQALSAAKLLSGNNDATNNKETSS